MTAPASPKKTWLIAGLRIAAIFACIVVTVAVGFDINKRTNAIQSAHEEVAARKTAKEQVGVLRGQSERAARYRDFLTNILPQHDQLIAVPRELDSIGDRNGVDVGFKFREGNDTEESGIRFASFQMTARGELAAFIKFLKDTEASRFFIEFESIEFSKTGRTINAALGGKVFSR